MPTTAEQILNEALSLPLEARADLTERLVARLAEDVPVEIARAQLDEVHRRIAQVESGEVPLISGDDALARVRRLFGEHSAIDAMRRFHKRSYWILENHPISRLINREAKLGKQTVTE